MLPAVPWTGLEITQTLARSALPHAPVIADEEHPTRPSQSDPRGSLRRRLRLIPTRA